MPPPACQGKESKTQARIKIWRKRRNWERKNTKSLLQPPSPYSKKKNPTLCCIYSILLQLLKQTTRKGHVVNERKILLLFLLLLWSFFFIYYCCVLYFVRYLNTLKHILLFYFISHKKNGKNIQTYKYWKYF